MTDTDDSFSLKPPRIPNRPLRKWVQRAARRLIGLCTYDSSDETFSGKYWVDGRKIFRHVVDFGYLPNAGSDTADHGRYYEFFTSITGFAYDSSSVNRPMPCVDASNPIELLVASQNVTITTTSDMSDYYGFVILEYVKP